MELFGFVFVAFALLSVSGLEKARYDNYRVYKIIIDNEDKMQLIIEIEENPDGVSSTYEGLQKVKDDKFSLQYNFWNSLRHVVGTETQLVVPPHKFGEFSELNERFTLSAQLITGNLQE